jgi:hypothetical protein
MRLPGKEIKQSHSLAVGIIDETASGKLEEIKQY